MIDLIAPDLIERLLDKWIPISHTDISSRFDIAGCQRRLEGAGLFFGDSSERRAAADLLVIAARFLLTLGGDQPCERLLHRAPRKTNDVRISEEIEEKRPNVFEGLRPAEIE